MKTRIIRTLSLLSLLLLVGCLFQGQEKPGTAQVSLDLRASAETAALAKTAADSLPFFFDDSTGLRFTVTEARLNVKKVKLETEKDSCPDMDKCPGDEKLSFKGPFVVDLLTGASTPDVGILSVPAGTYRKVKIQLDDAKSEDGVLASGDELLGHTLLVKGTVGPAGLPGISQPFTLALTFKEELELKHAGLKLDAGALNRLLVAMSMGGWFRGVDVSGCLGKIKVSSHEIVVFSEASELGKCLDVENTVKMKINVSFSVEKQK